MYHFHCSWHQSPDPINKKYNTSTVQELKHYLQGQDWNQVNLKKNMETAYKAFGNILKQQ